MTPAAGAAARAAAGCTVWGCVWACGCTVRCCVWVCAWQHSVVMRLGLQLLVHRLCTMVEAGGRRREGTAPLSAPRRLLAPERAACRCRAARGKLAGLCIMFTVRRRRQAGHCMAAACCSKALVTSTAITPVIMSPDILFCVKPM